MYKNTLVLIFLSFFLGLVLVGCGEKEPDSSLLENRVLARWDALKNLDFKQAYTYFTPAYRKLFPIEVYLQSTGTSVKWVHATIKEKLIDGDRAKVAVNVRYQLNFPGPEAMSLNEAVGTLDKNIMETWLWRDGNWWYGNEPKSGL